MTDKILRRLTLQLADLAKEEMRIKHTMSAVLVQYYHRYGMKRLSAVEVSAERNAGPNWLNDPQAKELVFGVIRATATVIPPDALGIATVVEEHALMACMQTPERVCIFTQTLVAPGPQFLEDQVIDCLPQVEWKGRFKFFGEKPPTEIMDMIDHLLMLDERWT